jgi:hypothetical protein
MERRLWVMERGGCAMKRSRWTPSAEATAWERSREAMKIRGRASPGDRDLARGVVRIFLAAVKTSGWYQTGR